MTTTTIENPELVDPSDEPIPFVLVDDLADDPIPFVLV